MASTGTAKALSVILAIGAVLMAFIASDQFLQKPIRVDDKGDLAVFFAVSGVWLAIYLVVGCVAAFDAVRLTRRRDLGALQQSANLVKLVAVPFFLLNFYALAQAVLVVGAGDSDRLGLDGILTGLLFAVLTYVVMLPTSAYGVAILVLLRRDERIGRAFFGVGIVLHFLFVVDVLSTIVVVEVARDFLGTARPPGAFSKNLLTVVLAVGSAIAVVWLVLFAIFHLIHRELSDFLGDGSLLSDAIYQLGFSVSLEFLLLVMMPIVPLIAFRTAVQLFVARDLETLSRSARTVKLVMIPLFIQNFVVCAVVVYVLTLVPLVITRGAILEAGPAGIAFVGTFTAAGLVPAVIGTYLMLLPTSVYSLVCLALLLRQRAITPGFYLLHTLLQFVFVADIISTLALTRRSQQLLTTSPTLSPA
ncbi:MAG TPA: DUF6652 family protein [Kribbella sp.]